MRKRGISEVIVRAVMSLYEGAKTSFRIGLSKGLKVNLGKTEVVVSGAEGKVSVSKVDSCGICGKPAMADSVLCVKCGK